MKNGWQTKRLGDVCEFDKSQDTYSCLPYVGLEDIESNTGRFIGATTPKTVRSSTFKFTTEHILYGRLRPYLNKVFAPDFEGHCSTEIFPIKPAPGLERKYLLYWLLADETVVRINETCTGARMPRADMTEVLEFAFPLPPIPEQQRIVGILDEAFAAIATAKANAEKNLQNARAVLEGHLHCIFTQSGEGWMQKALGECFRLKSGDSMTSKAMVPGPFPVFGGNGIAGMHNEYNLSGNNVIIGRVGALCGNVRHVTDRIWLTDNAFRIVDFTREFDNAFLTYLLNYKNLRSLARQAAQPVISNSSLQDLVLSFPGLTEQTSIAAKLASLSGETQQLESIYQKKLVALEELKKSLLHHAFTGQL